MKKEKIWISWHYHRRSDFLAREFGSDYYHFGTSAKSRLSRYRESIGRTITTIRHDRPGILFVQNPSIILVLLAVMLKQFFRYILINDLHTPYIDLPPVLAKLFWALQRFCIRHSDLTIVTNDNFRQRLHVDGVMILPDTVPSFDIEGDDNRLEGINILYVCTFAEDEPYGSVFRAAELLPDGFRIFVTGNFRKAGIDRDALSGRIDLTGYLPDREYLALLSRVDIVMVLTEQEGCIVCGGYEGVSLSKPLILSDTDTLKGYFSSGAVYTRHDERSIADAIIKAAGDRESLKKELESLKESLRKEWLKDFNMITFRIEDLKQEAGL